MELIVYLAGEIHSDWRDVIVEGASAEGLPIEFLSPVTDHSVSDDVGVEILGAEAEDFWKDIALHRLDEIKVALHVTWD